MFWLDPHDDGALFPDVERALREPDGLLAAGGDLSHRRLMNAYRHGIFPWYSAGQPILWRPPDPRAGLYPERLHVSRRLRKTLRKGEYEVRFDSAFRDVVTQCAQPRGDGLGTWLTEEMIEAYCVLHRLGYAHSAESWHDGKLVGGLYGIAIGMVFFGESMFARRSDASCALRRGIDPAPALYRGIARGLCAAGAGRAVECGRVRAPPCVSITRSPPAP